MADHGIGWLNGWPGRTGLTVNDVTGCTPCSNGCKNCYAARLAATRLNHNAKYEGLTSWTTSTPVYNGQIRLHPAIQDKVERMRKPRAIFWNDMSDGFHKAVPNGHIDRRMAIVGLTTKHIHIQLTKRYERMAEYYASRAKWPGWPRPHVILGMSVSNQKDVDYAVPHLLKLAGLGWKTMLSVEPLLSGVDLTEYMEASYNPIHANNQTSRSNSVSTRNVGRTGDRQSRSDLESSEAGMGSVEAQNSNTPMQESASRTRHGQLPNDSCANRREAVSHTSKPGDLASLPRTDPRNVNGESQEREQTGQPAVESGIGDVLGTSHPLHLHTQEESVAPAPARTQKPQCNADLTTSAGDSSSPQVWQESQRTGEPVRCCVPDHLKDLPRPFLGSSDLVICGGESGPGARPCNIDWIRSIVEQCNSASVPVFVKQLGNNPWEGNGFCLHTHQDVEVRDMKIQTLMLGHACKIAEPFPMELKHPKGADPSEWPDDLHDCQQYPKMEAT
ncbi:MAG: DUF5131 family protein [Acidiferrobacterales bacterium]